MADALATGRQAAEAREWTEAVASLAAADREHPLDPADLETLAAAAWWAAEPEASNEALERAFAAYSEAGQQTDAGRVAMTLAYQAFRGLDGPVGGGWLARAQALLADQPEGPVHARLALMNAIGVLQSGHLEAGLPVVEAAIETARRTGATSDRYVGTAFKGMAMALLGNWQEGMAALDEAAAAASSGQLELRAASDIFCMTIAACRNIGDLGRAGQWAEEGERWMRRNAAGGFPGVCRVHRAELKMLHGNWSEAEQDATQACDELRRFRLLDGVGFAQNTIGDVRLRMGDLEGAAEAYDRAYEYGHDGQPGLARLQLARGEIGDAQRSLGRALAATAPDGSPTDRATRARLLPTQVDVAIAAGDLAAARAAVEEIEQLATDFGRAFYQAGALTARGELLLHEQRPADAEPVLGRSWRMWQTNELPYEAARARLRYAEALAAEGDETTARRDRLAARAIFERLGATRDIQAIDALLGGGADAVTAGDAGGATDASTSPSGEAARDGRRLTRTFMFTDIVVSTELVTLVGDEAWSELLGWHDRELRAAISGHGGEVVSHTGDGFFVTFERAADGIDCAVDIQRRLARHRREHGFAPWVRIGLHQAEATRTGRNYFGKGVHLAARVGASAAREEILVTAETVRAAGSIRFGLSEPRSIQLKGVREPVDVQAVAWR